MILVIVIRITQLAIDIIHKIPNAMKFILTYKGRSQVNLPAPEYLYNTNYSII